MLCADVPSYSMVLELVMAREAAHAMGGEGRHPLKTIGLAVRNAVIHPVPLPILAGLLWGQTGWLMPEVLDKPIQWLGATFGPLALLMVGITLSNVLDRVIHGYVVDFLDFHWGFLAPMFPGGHFPAFNVADSSITVGAGLLILDGFRKPRQG